MKYFSLFLILIAGLLALASLALNQSPEWHADHRIEWMDCWFENPTAIKIHCGRFYPGDMVSDELVSMPVILLRKSRWRRDSSPIIYLHGGPGSSSYIDSDNAPYWLDEFQFFDWPGDLLIYDQRGTGLSSPHFTCPTWVDGYIENIGRPITIEEESAILRQMAKDCIASVNNQGRDGLRLSTHRNVSDFIKLIDSLGYKQVRLYGVSYGTRLAMETARQYPDRISAMLLDSAYPPNYDSLEWLGWLYADTFNRLELICSRIDECSQSVPDLWGEIESRYHQLNEHPLSVKVDESRSHKALTAWITGSRFLDMLVTAMYWEPWLVIDALRSENDELEISLQNLVLSHLDLMLDTSFSLPVYIATECADLVDLYPAVRATGRDWLDQHVSYIADPSICEKLERDNHNIDWYLPVESDIPTLFLSGWLDPVTPPSWAMESARFFTQATVQVFPFLGHSLTSNACPVYLAREFFLDPGSKPMHKCLSMNYLPDIIGDTRLSVNQ